MYFRRLVDTNGPFQLVVRRYIQAFVNTLSQTVVCNNAHPVDQRMCRWLLMTHDRVGSDTFQLTQDFLAQMLGVRRPSVSVVARILYDAGLIRYVRGRITIVDRAKLEAAACECYFVVRNEFDRLFESTAA